MDDFNLNIPNHQLKQNNKPIGFQVPDNYFEQLAERIDNKLYDAPPEDDVIATETKTQALTWKPYLAIAAGFAAVVMAWYLVLNFTQTPVAVNAADSLQDTAYQKYTTTPSPYVLDMEEQELVDALAEDSTISIDDDLLAESLIDSDPVITDSDLLDQLSTTDFDGDLLAKPLGNVSDDAIIDYLEDQDIDLILLASNLDY